MHRRPQERRTGRTPHDPAWPSCSHDRATPAPVNGMSCARCRGAGRHAHQSRRNSTLQALRPGPEAASSTAHRTLCGSSRQALAHPETQIPIGNRLRPAGSCMRDFRTPDGTRNPSAFRPLRYCCPCLKADGVDGSRSRCRHSDALKWCCRGNHTIQEPSAMQITTLGLDLAKSVFQVHAVDAEGHVVVRKALRRAQVLPFFAKLPSCLVGMVSPSARSSGTRADKAWPRGAADAASLREALCEAGQDGCGRC